MSNLSGRELDEFKGIYEDNQAFVRKSLYWLVSEDAVDDIVQEVFVKIWQAYSKFANRSKIQTWIYRITMNSAYDYMRKEKRHTADEYIDLVDAGVALETKVGSKKVLRLAIK